MTDEYRLSMTSTGTYQQEMLLVGQAYLETQNWDEVRRQIRDKNLLMLNTASSRARIGREMMERMKTLAPDELEFFVRAHGDDLSAMTWLVYCRTYPIMKSFSKELLAERYAKMKPDVSKEVYQAFVDEQKLEHPELSNLTPSSLDKIQTRIFGMARDCHLLSQEGEITPLYPSPSFVRLVRESSQSDLSVFPKVGALI